METFADYGIEIQRGSNRAHCPSCTPERKKKHLKDLAVDYDNGLWHCHHCGWEGSLKKNNYQKTTMPINKVYKKPTFIQKETYEKNVLDWFSKRGISEKTLFDMKLSVGMKSFMSENNEWVKKKCIQFPYFLDGEVINIKSRSKDKEFLQEKDARKCLYNYDMAINSNEETLIITEGEMDTLSLIECGFTAVVSTPDGAPSPNTKTYNTKFDFLDNAEKLINKFETVILAVDNDEAGKRLEEELCSRIGIDKCRRVTYYPNCKDCNDVLVKYGKNDLRTIIESAVPYPIDDITTYKDVYFDLVHLQDVSDEGYSIGWHNTENLFNVKLGQLTVVTGIPSHGKSSFVDNILVNLWKLHGLPSCIFSPENFPIIKYMKKIVQIYLGRNFFKCDDNTKMYGIEQVSDGFYFISPRREEVMMDIETLLNRARSLVFRHGIKVFVLDPWNEIEHNMKAGEREDLYISRCLAKIKRFAHVNNVHVFMIAHPSKLVKNNKGAYDSPTAYDIAGGAMWRNKADNILCVYRPDLKENITEVHIQKIRYNDNGTAGETMKFSFDVSTNCYNLRA